MQETNVNALMALIEGGYTALENAFSTAIVQLSTHHDEKQELILIQQNEVRKHLRNSIDSVKATIEDPYYVLFYGRYSHGKTSLVNKLFEIVDHPLKTGSSQMTSRMIRVEFIDREAASAQRQLPGESVFEPVDINTLGDASSGSDQIATGFIYSLPYGQSAIAKQFFDHHVNLIDAPGMGGKYAPPPHLMLPYFREADLIVLAISAIGIKEAAQHIDDLLSNPAASGKLKLVALTFWDLVDSHPEYANIPEEERAQYVTDVLKRSIPSLKNEAVICVSAQTDHNIPYLRDAILNTLLGAPPILGKSALSIRVPEHKSRRLSETMTALRAVASRADHVLEKISSKMSGSIDPRVTSTRDNMINSLSNELRVLHNNFNRSLTSHLRDGMSNFITRLNHIDYMRNESELSNFQHQFKNDINEKVIPTIKEEIQKNFEADVISPVITTINKKLIDSGTIDTAVNVDLPSRLRGFGVDISDMVYELPIMIQEKGKQAGKSIFSTIIEVVTDPSFIGFAVLMLAITFGLQLLAQVDTIENLANIAHIDLAQIRQLVILVAFLILGIKIWTTYASVSSRTFVQSREEQKKKILSSFDVIKYTNMIANDVKSAVGKIDGEISESLRGVVDDKKLVDSTIRNLRKEINDNIKSLTAAIDSWES